MATEIKNAFKEIVDRLEHARDGSLLNGVKLVEGPTNQEFYKSDLPAVVYEILDGGFSEDAAFPARARNKFTVLFTVMTDTEKGYYSDDEQGIIDLFERIMTALDVSRTTGLVDLKGADNWGPIAPQYRIGSFEKSELMYQYLIEAEFQTKRYGRGELRS